MQRAAGIEDACLTEAQGKHMFDTPFDRYDDLAATAARDEEEYRLDSYEPIAPVSETAHAINRHPPSPGSTPGPVAGC